MKKIWIAISALFLFLWQLPQELTGWLMLVAYLRKGKINRTIPYESSMVFRIREMNGGLSLGRYIFVNMLNFDLVRHEYGHSRQSKILGPLYLLIIGLPSLIWFKMYRQTWKKSYYWFYTERWADYLGGIRRK